MWNGLWGSEKPHNQANRAERDTPLRAVSRPLIGRPLCDTKSLQEVSSELRGPPVPPGESRGLNQERP